MVGALQLAPLVGLAAWALALRVGEYGWTTTRITAGVGVLIAAGYATMYGVAVARGRPWLKGIEAANFVAAYLALALFLALFSPVADPARLMVISQVGRLESGKVTPEAFDFVALKFDAREVGDGGVETAGPDPDRAERGDHPPRGDQGPRRADPLVGAACDVKGATVAV